MLLKKVTIKKLVNVQARGRAQELSLSEKGQALVKRITQILNEHETYFFSHIKKPQELISSLSAIRQQLTKK